MLLFLDICVFELRHILPAWHGQGLVQDNPCSKHIQPLEQNVLPLQVKNKTNEQQRKPCQLVSDLDVVGGLYTNKRPSPPSFTNQIYHS
jgi:hypothetical protein